MKKTIIISAVAICAVLAVCVFLSLKDLNKNEVAEIPAEPAGLTVFEYVEAANREMGSVPTTDGVNFELLATDSSMVYKYTYTEEHPEDWYKETVANLDKAFKGDTDYYHATLVIIQKECPAVKSIVYEYYKADGSLVYTFEIK